MTSTQKDKTDVALWRIRCSLTSPLLLHPQVLKNLTEDEREDIHLGKKKREKKEALAAAKAAQKALKK